VELRFQLQHMPAACVRIRARTAGRGECWHGQQHKPTNTHSFSLDPESSKRGSCISRLYASACNARTGLCNAALVARDNSMIRNCTGQQCPAAQSVPDAQASAVPRLKLLVDNHTHCFIHCPSIKKRAHTQAMVQAYACRFAHAAALSR
jgi:hypothetical protein